MAFKKKKKKKQKKKKKKKEKKKKERKECLQARLVYFLDDFTVSILTAQLNAGCLVYVTTSYTPASLSGVNIMFNAAQYDPGNNFNMTTSEYHVPVTGYYLVASHLMSDEKEGHQIIRVNGIGVIFDHMYDFREPRVVTEPTIVLNLTAGDVLSVQHSFAYGGNILGLTGSMMQTWLSVALLHSE